MDAASLALVQRLIEMGTSSLLQYVCEASPWAPAQSQAARASIQTMAEEERDAAAHLTRYMQKKRVRLKSLGSYPSHFTTINFVSVDYLLPKLRAEHEKEVAELEGKMRMIEAEEFRNLGQNYLDMKRRHLQSLREACDATPA